MGMIPGGRVRDQDRYVSALERTDRHSCPSRPPTPDAMSEHPDATREILEIATAEAAGARAEAVEPLHLLIAVCRSELPQLRQAFEAHGIDQVRFRRRVRGFARQVGVTSESGPLRVSGRVRRLLELAGKEAGSLLRPVDAVCVFVALLRSPDVHVEQVFDIERVPA